MKARFSWALLVLLFLPLVGHGQFRATDLENPRPVSVPDGLSAEVVRDALFNALEQRDWSVVSEDQASGTMVAEIQVRSHWAQIGIEYDTDQVQIEYRDSENLHYDVRDGREIIHRNYLGWVDNVIASLRQELNRASRR